MCKIYNVKNNKTDICFYHYIDEIIVICQKKKKILPPNCKHFNIHHRKKKIM